MDPIANCFSQIKNAINASKKEVMVSYSKVKLSILQAFKELGYISDFEEIKIENQKYPAGILIKLKFDGRESAISNIKRVSKPGRRVYSTSQKINKFKKGKSEILISTSQGIMSGRLARQKGLGGEIICEVE